MPSKIGNPGTATVNAARMMPPGPGSDCEKLEVMNEELRGSLSKDRKSKSLRKAFGKKGPTTVASGSLSGGGGVFQAGSRLLPTRYDNRVSKGLWKEKSRSKRASMRKSGKSNLCPEPAFKYGEAYRPHQSHCESKMLEDMFAPSSAPPIGRTLTLNINWQSSGGPSKLPCAACKKLLCHAQQHCRLTIKLCQKDPEDPPAKLKCTQPEE